MVEMCFQPCKECHYFQAVRFLFDSNILSCGWQEQMIFIQKIIFTRINKKYLFDLCMHQLLYVVTTKLISRDEPGFISLPRISSFQPTVFRISVVCEHLALCSWLTQLQAFPSWISASRSPPIIFIAWGIVDIMTRKVNVYLEACFIWTIKSYERLFERYIKNIY